MIDGTDFTSTIQSNVFKIEDKNNSARYTSMTGHMISVYMEGLLNHTLMTRLTGGLVVCRDTDSNEDVQINPSDIYRSSAWGGINTSLNTSLQSLANIGSTQAAEPSAVNVSTSTWTSLASVTLSGGVWLILAKARFASNSTGRRGVRISTSSSGSEVGQLAVDSETAVSGSETHVSCMWITSNLSSSTIFYLQGWQNSGSTLSTLPRIKAVRIR